MDALAQMDFILTLTEFVRKSFFLQLLVRLDNSLKAQEVALPALLDVELAQTLQSVLHAHKMDFQLSMESAKLFVEMGS